MNCAEFRYLTLIPTLGEEPQLEDGRIIHLENCSGCQKWFEEQEKRHGSIVRLIKRQGHGLFFARNDPESS